MAKIFTDETTANELRDKMAKKADAETVYTVEPISPTLNRPQTPLWAVAARVREEVGKIGGRWHYV